MASKKPSLVQLPCAKTREFGEAEFSDCLPVSALVCKKSLSVSETGIAGFGGFGLGLLVSQGLMCQSAPGPLNLFCDTELRFCRFCNFDLPNKHRFSLQRHKT